MNPTQIAVFCSSRSGNLAHQQAAIEVGFLIGRLGKTLIYGGSACGIMELLAQQTHRAGGRVCGIIPHYLVDQGLESTYLDECIICSTVAERKELMLCRAEVCIVLPGGTGTLDEFFTAIARGQIGEGNPPIILYNHQGFWQPLVNLLKHLVDEGLLDQDTYSSIQVIDSLEALEFAIAN